MVAYYNEIDPYCCAWLSNLMDAGHITPGKIDDRPIQELTAKDVEGYQRVHFFAGIAGWDYALNLANWGERFVWTGSCPCQPFSTAGKQKGKLDDRHLWPTWFDLIRECRPATIFGEQVSSAITHGWLDDCAYDLETEDYAVAAAVLPACSIGASHKRERLWFVGNALKSARKRNPRKIPGKKEKERSQGKQNGDLLNRFKFAGSSGRKGDLAHTNREPQKRIAESWSECNHWFSEPTLGRVANGVSARTHKLRAYGNAIVPQLAAEFIKTYMEVESAC